jgi:hypothetical protein
VEPGREVCGACEVDRQLRVTFDRQDGRCWIPGCTRALTPPGLFRLGDDLVCEVHYLHAVWSLPAVEPVT